MNKIDIFAIFQASDEKTQTDLQKVIEVVEEVFTDDMFLRILTEEMRVKEVRLCLDEEKLSMSV